MSYGGIDRFRMVAAFLVVAIHTSPLTSYSKNADFALVGIFARIAVPFFLMVSGFFLLADQMKTGEQTKAVSKKKIQRFLWKTAILYLLATVLYLPVNIYAGHYSRETTGWALFKDILFDGTFYHLWYLPAAIIGCCLVLLLLRFLNAAEAMVVAFQLYLIGLFGDSYYGVASQIPVLRVLYDGIFSISDYTRNGIFYAPVFLLLGAYLGKDKKNRSRGFCLTGLLLSLLLLLGEGFVLHGLQLQRHDSMYVFLLPVMYFLFQTLLQISGPSQKSLRQISMLIYLLHPLMIIVIRGAAKLLHVEAWLIGNSLLHFLAVAAVSWLFSIAVTLRLERQKAGKI